MRQLAKPANEPVFEGEIFEDRRLTTADESALIKRLISSAREECENITRRMIASRQFEILLDSFAGDIALVPPAISVQSVKYYDSAGALQTVDPSAYALIGSNSLRPRIVAKTDWPTARAFPESVVVTATLGYAAGTCPDGIRSWIVSRVGTLFSFREQLISGGAVAELPYINALLDQYIVAGAYARG